MVQKGLNSFEDRLRSNIERFEPDHQRVFVVSPDLNHQTPLQSAHVFLRERLVQGPSQREMKLGIADCADRLVDRRSIDDRIPRNSAQTGDHETRGTGDNCGCVSSYKGPEVIGHGE
eukprot:s1_g831.t1